MSDPMEKDESGFFAHEKDKRIEELTANLAAARERIAVQDENARFRDREITSVMADNARLRAEIEALKYDIERALSAATDSDDDAWMLIEVRRILSEALGEKE